MRTIPDEAPTAGSATDCGRRNRFTLRLFCGVWLIGSGATLIFATHLHDPFRPFTSRMPVAAIPLPIALYAAVVAIAWRVVPEVGNRIVDEFVRTGCLIMAGLSAPHVLTRLAERFLP